MKFFILILIFAIFISNCSNPSTNGDLDSNINFFTDKPFYTEIDTISLTLTNNSDRLLIIGLRCGEMLEMFYQKKENDLWSENLWFDYMTLRCYSLLDSVNSNDEFQQSIPTSIFKDTGTFRLILNEEIVSNSFDIN